MSTKPIKVGFVGLSTQGWASTTLAPTLINPALSDRYVLTAVSTTSEESATATAKLYSEKTGNSVKAFWGDSSKIANDPEVDFIVVSVKPWRYKAVLEPIIAAGKPFFAEWPGGVGLRQIGPILESAKAKNLRGIVGLQGKQDLVIRKAKELLDSGKIGQLRSTHAVVLFPAELGVWGPAIKEEVSFATRAENGCTGPEMAGGHFLGPFLTVLGKFATVTATGITAYTSVRIIGKDGNPTGEVVEADGIDHVAFSGRLVSGALASLTWRFGQKSSPGRTQLLWEIDGEEGTIRIESQAPHGGFINLNQPNLYLNGELIEVPNQGLTANLTRAWEEYAKGEAGHYADLDDALEVHRTVDAIIRSARDGVTVALN